MLQLKNVSKFYYDNGIVTSGFSRVNLELKLGEFVTITGESGSGKSTLLNVISGLDSYEEGEMYINGEETSAYSNKDFEDYRRRYIANIYQTFNLVNSYTVYQNVELALLLNQEKNVKDKINNILKSVGLYKYRNTKASKLSGGQKQRVAIARALVKDTPIIVADEPTGNLDSENAKSVLKLLSELAKDRLVIVVTHNYEQIAEYTTRKISMHDGRIIEDVKLQEVDVKDETSIIDDYDDESSSSYHFDFKSRLRLGIRNAFNLLPKFLLLTFVFCFMVVSVTSLYTTLRASDYYNEEGSYSYIFNNLNDKRIVIKKKDHSIISKEDYQELLELDNVDYIFYNDVLLDEEVNMNSLDGNYFFYGYINSLENYDLSSLEITGRLPENNDEVFLIIPDFFVYSETYLEDVLKSNYDLNGNNMVLGQNLKVVGICSSSDVDNTNIILKKEAIDSYSLMINASHSFYELILENNNIYNSFYPLAHLNKGEALYQKDNLYFDDNTLTIKASNAYIDNSVQVKLNQSYNKNNFTEKTKIDINLFDNYYGGIFISLEDYQELFTNESYQSSIFVENTKNIEQMILKLDELGYKGLYLKNATKNYLAGFDAISSILETVLIILLMIALFSISYFVIRLIMKSRNIYYSTVRMLGGTSDDCRSLICVELLVFVNLATILMSLYIVIFKEDDFVKDIIRYMNVSDYVILYILLIVLTLAIALRYAHQLFKKSAISTYKEV